MIWEKRGRILLLWNDWLVRLSGMWCTRCTSYNEGTSTHGEDG